MVARKDKEGSGFDETGLGRWSWIQIKGKAKELIVFISAYRLCKNRNDLNSVWRQQERFFKARDKITSPNVQTIFENDLCKFIQSTMEEGHKVVLGMDINDDVRKCECSKKLNNIGMKEIIINSHKERSPPSTHNRNRTRKPIDSIWASNGVEAVSCGFLPFHDEKGFHSDHRLVWVDFCNESLLGHRPQRIFRAPRSKVKSNNPISREKYIDRTKKLYIEEEIIEEYKTFQELCKAQRAGMDLMSEIEMALIHFPQSFNKLETESNFGRDTNTGK